MITINSVKLKVLESEDLLLEKAKKISGNKNLKYFKILKKSIDARDKNDIFFVYNLLCSQTPIESEQKTYGKISKKDFNRVSNQKFIGYYTRAKADHAKFGDDETKLASMYAKMLQADERFKVVW